MPWNPASTFVEVFLNGQYQGTYQLTQNIKVATDRVNIDELKGSHTDPSVITGGYLLEVDYKLDGDAYFTTPRGVSVVFQGPEKPNTAQFAYLRSYIETLEQVLYSDNFADPEVGYRAYIDVDAFIRWYLVNEIFKNNDAIMWTSCWMYKPRNGKLIMGPLWDFDISGGNININGNDNPVGWWVRNSTWISRMFEDPYFTARVTDVWNEIKTTHLLDMFESIDPMTNSLQQSQLNNFQRWPILGAYVWPNAVVTGSYDGEVGYFKTWLQTRIDWMDAQLNQ